jgi:Flp pilus assembly protein TadD
MMTRLNEDRKPGDFSFERLSNLPDKTKTVLLSVLLFALVGWAFFPAIGNGFTGYDDPAYVTDNARVKQGLTWEHIKWAFSAVVAANWHPLTMLSHMLDCQIFGTKPWGHHLTNVLLHAMNTVLLFLVLKRMTDKTGRSFFVAALFGLHPLHVQSVAWVAERKDVLSTLFWMLTLLAYARFVEESKVQSPKSKVFYAVALVCFALGLMSKPMVVTLPFVLLLLDYWPLGRLRKEQIGKLLREKLPFFALAAIVSAVTFAVQKNQGAVTGLTVLTFPLRLENAMVAYAGYLGKLFYPAGLSVFYPFPRHWPLEKIFAAAMVLIAISFFAAVLWRRQPWLLVGWLWFVGTLVPVIGLVQVGAQAMADRYTYVPSVGMLVLTVWGAYELTRRWRHHAAVLSLAGVVAIILCFVATRQQLGYWRDGETLFRHAIAVTGENAVACENLGVILEKDGHFDEAVEQFKKGLDLLPGDADLHCNLGIALADQKRFDEAISQYQQALKLDPSHAESHCELGISLGHKGLLAEAVQQLQAAARLDPASADIRYNLGNALVRNGQLDEAVGQLRAALKLNPDDADTHNNLGTALYQTRHLDGAIAEFQEALKLKPDFTEARQNLDNALRVKDSLSRQPSSQPVPGAAP